MQLIKKYPYVFAFIFGIFVLTALRVVLPPTPPPPEVFGTLPGFRLTDQKGEEFGTTQLQARTAIVNFIFTRCTSVCPVLTQKMKQVRERLEKDGVPVIYLSLSVDPEYDSPEKLLEYTKAQGVEGSNWHFLTGPVGDIRRLITGGFQVGMGDATKAEPSLMDIAHSEKFALLDGRSRIRGFYSTDKKGLADLDIRTRIVAREMLAQK